jgi:hypothetical protein
MMKISMKTILLATAATALIAAGPASAASRHHAVPRAETSQTFAATGVQFNSNDPYVVTDNGRYIGRDTDATIRLNLLRETPMEF